MAWDKSLFHWINATLEHPILDVVMPFVTRLENFIPVLIPLVLWMLIWDKKRGRLAVLTLALLITASDQLSSQVIKPIVGRPRPCHAESNIEGLVLRKSCGPGKSFPSSHATNTAAAGVFLAWRYRRWGWGLLVLSAVVGYSRIYLGLHFPFDVLCGWMLGGILGGLAVLGWYRIPSLWDSLPFRKKSA